MRAWEWDSFKIQQKGSTVYVTQYGAYHDQSVVLANMVMDKLAELGISKRGVETRDWGSGGRNI